MTAVPRISLLRPDNSQAKLLLLAERLPFLFLFVVLTVTFLFFHFCFLVMTVRNFPASYPMIGYMTRMA